MAFESPSPAINSLISSPSFRLALEFYRLFDTDARWNGPDDPVWSPPEYPLASRIPNRPLIWEVDLKLHSSVLQIPDISKFLSKVDWNAKFTFEQTMSDLLDYWRERIARGENFLVR